MILITNFIKEENIDQYKENPPISSLSLSLSYTV